jgi:hypothetical protein
VKSVRVAGVGEGDGLVIDLHDTVTIVRVDNASRDRVVAGFVSELGVSAVVRVDDAPAPPAPVDRSRVGPDGALAEAEAAVASAEAAVSDARAALDTAERAYTAAQDTLLEANRAVDKDARDTLNAAESRLEVAQAGAAAARRVLVQAREAREQELAADRDRNAQERAEVAKLREEGDALEAKRAELLERLGATPVSPDPATVQEALVGLRRLLQVKPRRSARGEELANRWVEVAARLAELPSPPAPPEWLVTPAMAALHEARAALAAAEAASSQPVDVVKVDAVERAHREVLEAEQRVMRKGSRGNRKRLAQAHEAEQAALLALGVSSYGEFLQQSAPGGDPGQSNEQRVEMARAALADAEAVWEELHGGQASPEYTAAKSEQAELRTEALALLAADVADDDLEERLRSHQETVVDTEWALQQLRGALEAQGVAAGDDVEEAAEEWLRQVPEMVAARKELDDELGAVDARLGEIEAALSEFASHAFFGGDDRATDADEVSEGDADRFADLAAALKEAEAVESEAVEALAEARRRSTASDEHEQMASARETDAGTAKVAVETARQRFDEASAALEAARAASAEAAADAARAAEAAAASTSANALTAAPIASEAWLLARLVAARAQGDEGVPVVVDARVVAAVATRALQLLERVAGRGQVVVLGDEGGVVDWAQKLGDRAAIRTI